jgi:multisubunit Na+/H+ antiporter MnhE subunit
MHLLNQQRSHKHLLTLQYHFVLLIHLYSALTNLAPPVTSSTELAGGILKSFAMYLSVDPDTETQTSIAIAAAVVLVTLTPITASLESSCKYCY